MEGFKFLFQINSSSHPKIQRVRLVSCSPIIDFRWILVKRLKKGASEYVQRPRWFQSSFIPYYLVLSGSSRELQIFLIAPKISWNFRHALKRIQIGASIYLLVAFLGIFDPFPVVSEFPVLHTVYCFYYPSFCTFKIFRKVHF